MNLNAKKKNWRYFLAIEFGFFLKIPIDGFLPIGFQVFQVNFHFLIRFCKKKSEVFSLSLLGNWNPILPFQLIQIINQKWLWYCVLKKFSSGGENFLVILSFGLLRDPISQISSLLKKIWSFFQDSNVHLFFTSLNFIEF